MGNKDEHRYDFMLDLPHKQSLKRKHMSMIERAAQFGAFRALTGYDDAVKETGRLTDERICLDEYQKSEIDRKLQYLKDTKECSNAIVTYFVPDTKKQGGTYVTKAGTVQKVCEIKRQIIFSDGTQIPIDEIIKLECTEKNEI